MLPDRLRVPGLDRPVTVREYANLKGVKEAALEDATGNNVGTVSAEIPVGPKWCEIRQGGWE